MKKYQIIRCMLALLVCLSSLTACSDNGSTDQVFTPVDRYQTSRQPNGHVDDKANAELEELFRDVVENNLFCGAAAFNGRLLNYELGAYDEESRSVTHNIQMLDIYGKALAAYTCTTDKAYCVTTLTATDDGGFLFVLGFQDYAYGKDSWASDNGFASRVIKCDEAGNVQFDKALDRIEGAGLKRCFETNDGFCFFGTVQTPETKQRGVHSYTDVYMVLLDKNGEVLKSRCIKGSDFDSLYTAEASEDGFILSISSQSDDGDFAGSDSGGYPKDWVISVNEDFEITERKMETGRSFTDDRIGEKDGIAVYNSSDFLRGVDAGSPTAFIDYGDFYLIVSENTTGIYEKTPPMISAVWYYTETVYSAYDSDGELIFRASKDSSPDYDSYVKDLEIQ